MGAGDSFARVLERSGVGSGDAQAIAAQVTFAGAAASNINVDLSNMTQFATESGITNVTRDGQSGGAIQDYRVEADGTIKALLAGGSLGRTVVRLD